jgi:hypothetical protein
MTAENPAPEGKINRQFIWGVVGLLCGIVLGLLISPDRSDAESGQSHVLEIDNNGDGKTDATFHYERGVITRAEHDCNFDGKPDQFEWYLDGIISRAESDDDFDGKIDGWLKYRNGNLWLSKHDTDKNGEPDVFQHFEHGVVKLVAWRPNECGKPKRIEFYEQGVKRRELRDTTGDGLLDTAATFDAFENQTSVEKLSKPLEAQDAISGDPHKP